MITVEPPVVQPSLGEIALMQGTAEAGYSPEIQNEYILLSKYSRNINAFYTISSISTWKNRVLLLDSTNFIIVERIC